MILHEEGSRMVEIPLVLLVNPLKFSLVDFLSTDVAVEQRTYRGLGQR